MSKLKYYILVICVMVTFFSSAQETNPLLGQLEFGKHKVGYQLIKAYDKARPPLREQLRLPLDQQKGRAVPIYFWYPAKPSDDPDMSLQAYLDGLAFSWDYELEEGEIRQKAKEEFIDYYFDWPEERLEAYFGLEINTLAHEDAAPADGKIPVVVFSHGHVDRWWIWGEYLASHGIAVVGTPNAGTFQKRHEIGISGLETQIRDAEFALATVSDYNFIDIESVVSAGSSYGSLTAVGLASRNTRVKGVISLDGIIADWNEGELLKHNPYMDFQLFNTPILHMHSGFGFSSNYIWMDQMVYADQFRIKMTGLRHADYHFHGMTDLLGFSFNGNELKNNLEGFNWVMDYSLSFIHGVTQGDKHLEYLKADPVVNGVPKDLMEMDFKKGLKDKPYSASDLFTIVRTQSFTAVSAIHQEMKYSNDRPFSPITYFDLGIMLHRLGLIEEEKIWFNYYLESYPHSAEARYRLARLEAISGNEEKGKELLELALNSVYEDPYLSIDRKVYLESRIQYFLGN